MCYNCGCGMLDDDMGKGRVSEGGSSLTDTDLKKMADDWAMSVEDTKRNILEGLQAANE